jgi:hypothetical protein
VTTRAPDPVPDLVHAVMRAAARRAASGAMGTPIGQCAGALLVALRETPTLPDGSRDWATTLLQAADLVVSYRNGKD